MVLMSTRAYERNGSREVVRVCARALEGSEHGGRWADVCSQDDTELCISFLQEGSSAEAVFGWNC